MEYRLIIALACLVLSLHAAAKPITIYTSEPIKVEEVPKKEPEKPKTEIPPIHAIIQAYITPKAEEKKPEEKKKPEQPSIVQPIYTLYTPYYSMYAMQPVNVVQSNFPFLYRLRMLYQLFG